MSENWLLNFQFEELKEKYNVRVTGTLNDPWFVTKDICDILGIKDNRKAVINLPDSAKGEVKTLTLGGEQTMATINESGLYRLVMRSNKPIAIKFQDWLFEIVIPSIRKTNEYKLTKSIEDDLLKNKLLIESQSEKIDTLSRVLLRKTRRSYKLGDTIYVIRQHNTNYYKIGITGNLNSRLSQLETGNPEELEVIYHRLTYANILTESIIKAIMIMYRMRLYNEFFVLDDPFILIDEINTVCEFIEGRIKQHNEDLHKEMLPEEEYECVLERTTKDIEIEQDKLRDDVRFKNPVMSKELFHTLKVTKGMKEVKKCYEDTRKYMEEMKNDSENLEIISDSKTYECFRCKVIKPLNFQNYNKSTSTKNGYEGVCKECRTKRDKENNARKNPKEEKLEIILTEPVSGESKQCKTCNIVQMLEHFSKSNDSKDGHISFCKTCKAIQAKQRYERNKLRYELYNNGKKKCKICETNQELTEYVKNTENIDGLDTNCKSCRKNKLNKRIEDRPIITEKACVECEEIKEIKDFYVETKNIDGFSIRCKVCYNEIIKIRRQKLKEKKRLESLENKET